VSVANRTKKSAQETCDQFNIPTSLDDPSEIINNKDIDAIVIGTWPNMHKELSCAALNAGKHVMVEARLAMNSKEAEEMLQTSRKFPNLIAQVVPAPMTLTYDHVVSKYVKEKIGKLQRVQLNFNQGTFPEYGGPLIFRHDPKLSGNNIMFLGIYYESIIRWVGLAKNVFANGSVIVDKRKDETGKLVPVNIPDLLTIVGNLENGSQFGINMSQTCGFNKTSEVWIYGDEGTLHVDISKNEVYYGSKNDKGLSKIDFEAGPGWRVEEEFVAAIRGHEKIRFTDWRTGVLYMRFTDAVNESMRSGKLVEINNNID